MNRRNLLIFASLLFLSCTSSENRYVKKAKEFVAQDQEEKAASFIQKALKKYPKNPDLLYLNGWVLMNQGRKEEAVISFAKSLHKDPQFYGGHKGYAAIYLMKKDFALAERELNLALKARPDLPEIYANLAEVKYHQGQYDQALEYLQKACTLQPQYADYPVLLADMQVRLKRLAEAQTTLKKINKPRFMNKPLAVKYDCVQGAVSGLLIEKDLSATSSKTPTPEQTRELTQARELLSRCEKADPKRFGHEDARARLAVLLAQP